MYEIPTAGRQRRMPVTERLSHRLRTQTAIGRRLSAMSVELRGRAVPLHWTSVFGVVSLASTAVLFLTGLALMFFYTPSGELVRYDGPFVPLQGAEVSQAFSSMLHLSLEVRGGLLLRQAHHWAALLLPISLTIQLLAMFFTGGFRRPRRASWVLLFLLFLVALLGGWSGYALPDDMLSGTGLRIVEGIILGIPFVGTQLSMLVFGGEFPGRIIENLYPIHVAVVPVLMVVLIAARVRSSYVHRPPQFAGAGRTGNNVVGVPMLPNAFARATGLFVIVSGILTLIAATVTINPIWLYGPASPGDASAGSQPDWYTGFLDGALRLVPPGWEVVWLDRTWTLAVLVPLAVIGVFLGTAMLFPFIESWITGDRREHHLLDRPRNAATRTAIGVAGVTFYGVLWGAASADLVATHFALSIEGTILALQLALLAGPVVAFSITRRVCIALQRKDLEIALHGYETGRIVRLPSGEYREVHEPVDVYDRWRLVAHHSAEQRIDPPPLRGRPTLVRLARAAVARWFLEDRIVPPAQTASLQHDQQGQRRAEPVEPVEQVEPVEPVESGMHQHA